MLSAMQNQKKQRRRPRKMGRVFSVGSMAGHFCIISGKMGREWGLSKELSDKGEIATRKAPREVCACSI